MNLNRNKKTKIFILAAVVLGGVLTLAGTSYAFFTASANSGSQTVTVGTLTVNYTSGTNIASTNMIPVAEATAPKHTFTIQNTGSLPQVYSISMLNISLKKAGVNAKSENLKYALYKATSEGSNYVQSGSVVATGTFGTEFTLGASTRILISDQTLSPGITQSYILKVWLNDTGAAQNEDQGLAFSTNISITATTAK